MPIGIKGRRTGRSSITRRTLLALMGACGLVPLAHGAEFDGLLRSRDLTPFGFLRLDMLPAHAVRIEPHTWAIEAEVGYQNTWALSPRVEEYLTALEATGARRALSESEIQAIRDLPGENYLVDLESASFDIAFHYRMSANWSGYLIATGVSYDGGFLDSTIEGFHDTFGFSTFGREALSRNRVNLVYDLKSTRYASIGSPSNGGLGDPVIGVRYTGLSLPAHWRLSVEAAAKIAVAGRRDFLSTGNSDFGVQAAVQRVSGRHALYLNAAAVYYAGGDFPVRQDSQVIPTMIVGVEYAVTRHINVLLQGYASPSVYSHRQTDLDELLKNKYQLTIGARYRTRHSVWSVGFTENLQNLNNTPDIGFQLGFAWLPARVFSNAEWDGRSE
jgi:hypothetical protein